MAGCCEYDNEPLGNIEFGEYFDCMRKCLMMKKDPD